MIANPKKTKELLTSAVRLMVNHQWLVLREKELISLIEESEEHELQVITELLDRFVFLLPEDIKLSLDALVNQILHVWNLDGTQTQIVAVSWDEFADSGQAVLHAIKPILARQNSGPLLVNVTHKAKKYFQTHPNIVLIDEFSGTGNTILNRINELNDQAQRKGIKCNIYVALIACMEDAKRVVTQAGVPVFAAKELKKGITGYHIGADLAERLAMMASIEGKLAPTWEGENLPHMGYGGAEALYGADGWNVPNSVFPVFWWPYRRDSSKRLVLLERFAP